MREDDPDETEGRKLYRDHADALARAQVSIAKRGVKMTYEPDPWEADDDFCVIHGRDHMKRDKGPISYCAECERGEQERDECP